MEVGIAPSEPSAGSGGPVGVGWPAGDGAGGDDGDGDDDKKWNWKGNLTKLICVSAGE